MSAMWEQKSLTHVQGVTISKTLPNLLQQEGRHGSEHILHEAWKHFTLKLIQVIGLTGGWPPQLPLKAYCVSVAGNPAAATCVLHNL